MVKCDKCKKEIIAPEKCYPLISQNGPLGLTLCIKCVSKVLNLKPHSAVLRSSCNKNASVSVTQ